MTKDLLGWYYAQSADGVVQIVQFLDGKCYYLGHEDIMAEPICRVPEYEEYKQLKKFKHWEKISCDDAPCCKTVKELRDLLKECQEIIEWYKADCGYKDLPTESVLTKIEKVLK